MWAYTRVQQFCVHNCFYILFRFLYCVFGFAWLYCLVCVCYVSTFVARLLVCDDTPVHIKVWGKAPACLQGYVGRTCDGKLWPTPAHAVWPWREHTVSCVYARKLHSLSHAHTNTHTRTHAQSRTHTQSHVCMSHV